MTMPSTYQWGEFMGFRILHIDVDGFKGEVIEVVYHRSPGDARAVLPSSSGCVLRQGGNDGVGRVACVGHQRPVCSHLPSCHESMFLPNTEQSRTAMVAARISGVPDDTE